LSSLEALKRRKGERKEGGRGRLSSCCELKERLLLAASHFRRWKKKRDCGWPPADGWNRIKERTLASGARKEGVPPEVLQYYQAEGEEKKGKRNTLSSLEVAFQGKEEEGKGEPLHPTARKKPRQ